MTRPCIAEDYFIPWNLIPPNNLGIQLKMTIFCFYVTKFVKSKFCLTISGIGILMYTFL